MSELEEILKGMVLFEQLSSQELTFLSDYVTQRDFADGEIILRQGELGKNLYIIQRGDVSVWIKFPGDVTREAAQLHAGQFFGEVAFLTNTPATATIIANDLCQCLLFPRNVLEMIRVAYPETAHKIEQSIARLTAEKIIANIHLINQLFRQLPASYQEPSLYAQGLENRDAQSRILPITELELSHIENLSFFRDISLEQIPSLLSFLEIKEYDKGYRFKTSEDDGGKLGVIYSGAVMLFIKEEEILKKSIAVFGMGELFLENFFMPTFRQIANYVTCERSIILELDLKAYKQLHQSHPEFFYVISQAIYSGIAHSVYIVNRQFIRMSSEFHDLMH